MLEQHDRTHAYAYFGRLLRRIRVLEFREVASRQVAVIEDGREVGWEGALEQALRGSK